MKIYNIDCVRGAKKYFQDESVDLMVCDPPFGISESKFDKHYKRNDNVISGYQESPDNYAEFSLEWITEAKRVLKNNGSMYIVSGWTNLKDILSALDTLGLYVENHIIWKYNFGVYTKKKFVSSHYHILYVKKCKDANTIFNRNCRFGDDEKNESGGSLLYQDLEDVWVINKEYHPGKIKNQNKLPEALIEKIILYSSNEKDTVCDFFLGNFTTAVVAKKLNRIPCGFELNKRSFDVFIKELQNIEDGGRLKELRKVPENKSVNRGKPITKQEKKKIYNMYTKLRKPNKNGKRKNKKETILTIGEKFGRGYFSILNILNEKTLRMRLAQKYKSRSNSAQLDQFYTSTKIAKTIVSGVLKKIPNRNRKVFLEPSAGDGAFSDILIKKNINVVAFDLDPKKKYITKKDFFDVSKKDLGEFDSSEVCVIGNPPFGKNSSLAVKFFNHCAELADTICFIVPKTFKKQSIKNRLNLYFKLVKSKDLPKDSFLFDGEPYDIPCVFQIWRRDKTKRKVVKSKNECDLFIFVKKNEKPDFAVRRAGGRSGKAFKDTEELSEASNYFCKVKDGYEVCDIIDLINEINFSVIDSTAGVRSLSKGELIRAIERRNK